jgi:hypothetical protein
MRRRLGTRACKVGLLAAGAAVGSAGATIGNLAVAAASPATSSTKIYACYSDSTDALTYLNYPTVKKCASG